MRILAADQSGMRRSRGSRGRILKNRKYAPDPPSLPPPPLKKFSGSAHEQIRLLLVYDLNKLEKQT